MVDFDSKKTWLLDAGFSSQYSVYNLEEIDHPLWTSVLLQTNPDIVKQIHLDFLKAGADIIETVTYQASIEGFKLYLNLNEKESRELINKSVALAKEARDEYLKETGEQKDILIAGSIGPYGTLLHDCSEYTGSYIKNVTPQEIYQYYYNKMNSLISAGVDILAIETIPVFSEAEIIINVLKEFPNIKAWLSFSCKDNKSISSGEIFSEGARKCFLSNPQQLIAVGINCTNPDFIEDLIKDLQNEMNVPIVLCPNSGEKFESNMWTGKEACKPLDLYVDNWLKYNVKFIGGCCRTYAKDITMLRRKIDEINK